MKQYDITRSYGNFYLNDLFTLVTDKPIRKVALDQFKFIMYQNYWFDPDKEPSVEEFIEHYQRVTDADLSYPIIVLRDQPDILDGVHRLVKAFINGHDTIKVIYVSKKELMTINNKA